MSNEEVVKEEIGIKETLEIIDAAQSLSVDTIIAAKDGIDFSDLSVLTGNLEKIKNAVIGSDQVVKELKDLDEAETTQIAAAGVVMAFAILKALKKSE